MIGNDIWQTQLCYWIRLWVIQYYNIIVDTHFKLPFRFDVQWSLHYKTSPSKYGLKLKGVLK